MTRRRRRRIPGRPALDGEAQPVGRCPRCWLLPRLCVCGDETPADIGVEIVVVRHFHEARKSSNSARLLPLMLGQCRIIDYGDPRAPADLSSLDDEGTWLLFPPDHGEAPEAQALPPMRRLVVPDGTWGQVRRMVRRIDVLSRLPRFALAERPDVARVLSPHEAWAMSTAEAVAQTVLQLGHPEPASEIQRFYREFARAHRVQRGAPVDDPA